MRVGVVVWRGVVAVTAPGHGTPPPAAVRVGAGAFIGARLDLASCPPQQRPSDTGLLPVP
jgi:hypothetical protein